MTWLEGLEIEDLVNFFANFKRAIGLLDVLDFYPESHSLGHVT